MKPETPLVLLGENYSGRDEMNLAGNPFALLQAASKAGQNVIRYDFDRTLPSGKIVGASWEVTGHPELGLPGPAEELLYLVLLQMTREAAGGGEWPRLVPFSRFDAISRMGWSDKGGAANLLAESFLRLSNVTINAKNSFWNARAKAPYEVISFHLLEDFGIMAEPRGRRDQNALPLSWFRWNETLHDSFLAGNVRSLALDFVLALDGPTSRRLFRLLDMMRHATKPPRRDFSIGLMKLRDRLGMTPYAYPSKVREKLAPAIQDLKARGYLSGVEYRRGSDRGSEGEIAIFTYASVSPIPVAPPREAPIHAKTPVKGREGLITASSEPERVIHPNEAFAVFTALPEAEKAHLRDMARQQVEPAFWDRLENPASPMALVLWEIVAREHPELYREQIA